MISFFIFLKFRLLFKPCVTFPLVLFLKNPSWFFYGHIWLLNLWYSLLSPALLAHGHWHRSRFPGSHGLGLDGEELGSGKNPS